MDVFRRYIRGVEYFNYKYLVFYKLKIYLRKYFYVNSTCSSKSSCKRNLLNCCQEENDKYSCATVQFDKKK